MALLDPLKRRGCYSSVCTPTLVPVTTRQLGHALAHKVEESELASRYTVLVDEATGEIASENGTQIVLRYLVQSVQGTNKS